MWVHLHHTVRGHILQARNIRAYFFFKPKLIYIRAHRFTSIASILGTLLAEQPRDRSFFFPVRTGYFNLLATDFFSNFSTPVFKM